MTDPTEATDAEEDVSFKPPFLKLFLLWAVRWLLIIVAIVVVFAVVLGMVALDVVMTQAKANFHW